MCKRAVRRSEIAKLPEEANPKPGPPGGGPTLQSIDIENPQGWMESTRAEALVRCLKSIPADEKVVVFSYFSSFLRFLKICLDRQHITSELFTGELSAKRRDSIIGNFEQRDDPVVLLASITTCGVGMNLTRASRCFIMDPNWNPAIEEQAMNRLHRIGQTRPVKVVRFFAPGTVEQSIHELCVEKQKLQGYCFGRERRASRLGKLDIMRLFNGSADD